MGMKVEWDCKNGHTNDPEDPNYSWLRCSECPAWRWDWLKWAAGGLLALGVIVLGYCLRDLFFQKPEAIYKNNYKKYVLTAEKGKEEYTISPRGQKVLDELAERHKFPKDKVDNLVQEAREEVLAKLSEENRQNPTLEKEQEINKLTKKWGTKPPEAIYRTKYQEFVRKQKVGKEKYTVSPRDQKVLDDLAKNHKFSEDKVKNLVQEAQKEVLARLEEENRQNPTPEKEQEIKELTEKWGTKPPEAIYKAKYQEFVRKQEAGKEKYTVSPQDQKVLDDLAKRHKFPEDKVKNLVQEAQKGILQKLHADYSQNPTPEKGQEIKDLAKQWNIDKELAKQWGINLDALLLGDEDKDKEKAKGKEQAKDQGKEKEKSTTGTDTQSSTKTGVDKIKELLQLGKFPEARKELAQGGPGLDPEMDRLRQDMETPTELMVNFQYQRPRSKPSEKMAVSSPRLADLYLTPKDNYRMFIETHSPCYLYIFQIDAEGRVERLFPNPFYNKTDNPVLPLLSLQIPFTHSEWLYLEEVGREAPPKKNTLYFLASPWPAKHLDELYGKLYRETNREARNEILKEFMAALDSWKTAGLPALFFQEFNFFQVAKVPPARRPGKK